jgi:mRNA interferase RelE/StbE
VAYRLEFARQVGKVMARFPRQDQARILVAIKGLAEDPRPAGCVPVKDAPHGTYQVCVGDYWGIYTMLDDEQVIVVSRVARRSESTYRDLR